MKNRLRFHWNLLMTFGPRYLLWLVRRALIGRERNLPDLTHFSGGGLEIGGPSQFFQDQGEFPIYAVAENIDNVNYSSQTFWEGTLKEGQYFRYNASKPAGHQFICEASDLSAIPADMYDFIASCHTLEHCANPIKAMQEWWRVLKTDGWLVVILPHKAGTFDHQRSVTEFEHLLKDHRRGVTEEDETHFPEILEKHDLKRDPAQKSREDFEKWIKNNAITRGVHHHVFDPALAIETVDYVGFEVVAAEVIMPYHIFIVGQKSSATCAKKEKARLQVLQSCCERSPFKADKKRHGRQSLPQ
jgi:SAM-dependent methyltransferase